MTSDASPRPFASPAARAASLFRRLEAPFDRTLYLPAFRVFVAFHIVKKLALHWPYARLLYSGESFVVSGAFARRLGLGDVLERHYLGILVAYFLAAVFMGLGIGRRLAVFAVFLLTVVVQQMEPYTLNGGDNLLKFILLYLCLCDSFGYCCLQPAGPRPAWRVDLERALTRIGVLLMMGHLALVYAVSAAGKLHSEVWYNGVANYYIVSLDRFRGPGSAWIAGSAPLTIVSTYLTIFWEATFPFFMWHRRLRWVSIGLGLAIHAAIYLVMMIHDFEVLFVACYGLLFTDAEWRRAADWTRRHLVRMRALAGPNAASRPAPHSP